MRLTHRAAYHSQLQHGDLMLHLNLDKGLEHETLSLLQSSWLTLFNNQSVTNWMMLGAIREDSTEQFFGIPFLPTSRRYDNHFHTPLRAWETAGLDDLTFGFIPVSADSSILWSQNRGENNQENFPEGDNSWQQVRRYYFSALTTPSDSTGSNMWRTLSFISTFKGLGHQMHLLEDMAVPEHVRNDGHPLKTRSGAPVFERWADGLSKRDGGLIDMFTINPIFPSVDLNDPAFSKDCVQTAKLWDSGLYQDGVVPTTNTNWGLSEYTSSNFFSEDTAFSAHEDNPQVPSRHQFPYPKISSTNLNELMNDNLPPKDTTAEDGQIDRRLYISKVAHGETVTHFETSIYLEQELRDLSKINLTLFQGLYRDSFYRDELCHCDYAEKLVPRAVGYAAALVDYFFRGKIEIALPSAENPAEPSVEAKDDGVYAFTLDPERGFEEITLMARNVTPDEEMKNGQVKLLIRYRECPGDPFMPDAPAPLVDRPRYQVADPLPDPETGLAVTRIPSDGWIKLKFDISNQPIPMNAVDLNFTLVFKGDLGFETETGVAIGFRDVSEPSPLTIFNNTDKVCFNGTYVDWDDPALFGVADKNGDGVIDCSDGDLNITPNKILVHRLSFNGGEATDTNFNHEFSPAYELMPGQSMVIYVIGDEPPAPCLLSLQTSSVSTVSANTCYNWYPQGVVAMEPAVNKLEWNSEQFPGDFYTYWISGYSNFRGTYYHSLYHYENIDVPDGAQCPVDQLIIQSLTENSKKKSLLMGGQKIEHGAPKPTHVHGVWKNQRRFKKIKK